MYVSPVYTARLFLYPPRDPTILLCRRIFFPPRDGVGRDIRPFVEDRRFPSDRVFAAKSLTPRPDRRNPARFGCHTAYQYVPHFLVKKMPAAECEQVKVAAAEPLHCHYLALYLLAPGIW